MLQQGHPVAYASRSLSVAEQNYAQIKKEMLNVIFVIEMFYHYIYGLKTEVRTDHKPLVIIVRKLLHRASPRLQWMLLHLLCCDLELKYLPGKLLYIPDTLSSAPTDIVPTASILFKDMQMRVHQLVSQLPVSQHDQ